MSKCISEKHSRACACRAVHYSRGQTEQPLNLLDILQDICHIFPHKEQRAPFCALCLIPWIVLKKSNKQRKTRSLYPSISGCEVISTHRINLSNYYFIRNYFLNLLACKLYNSAYLPFCFIRSLCVPSSIKPPFSKTKILSHCEIVEKS